jgi:hypothetical protein
MYLKGSDPLAEHYEVVDLDTMEKIKYVREADDETGAYSIYKMLDGKILKDDLTGMPLVEYKRGNIILIRK